MKAPRIAHPGRVLLVQLRRLGDVVLTTALVEDLRRAFPNATVDFLVGDRAAPLLEHHPLIHERVIYDREHPLRTLRAIRARRYDWIIDPQSSPRTAPLALMSGSAVRAGFGVRGWGWVYTHKLARSGRPIEYVARERQRLLEMLGVTVGPPKTRLALTSQERTAGREVLAANGIRAGTPVIAFVLSAGEAAKEWPPAHFALLAEDLAGEKMQVVLFEMPGDAEKSERVTERSRAVTRIAVPAIRDFMGALTGCDLLVSSDTGPAHIATALRIPRVTIFGPEPPAAWSPADDPSVIVLRAEAARDLGTVPKGDPRHLMLTGQVTAAQVSAAVRTLLAHRGRSGGGASR